MGEGGLELRERPGEGVKPAALGHLTASTSQSPDVIIDLVT